MNTAEIIELLTKKRGNGSWRALAAKIDCSPAYLCDVILGRREPGPKILRYLGLRKQDAQYVKEAHHGDTDDK